MLTVAAQLDLAACLLAVIAAVLPVRPVRIDHALTAWMGAFDGSGHMHLLGASLRFYSGRNKVNLAILDETCRLNLIT